MINIRDKSWLWYLTFPFAHNNVTAWDGVIYKPRRMVTLSSALVEHERIHLRQQERVGKWKFALLYLFALPFGYNPWRYAWEMEAYTLGSNMNEHTAKMILRSYKYGWCYA